MTYGRVYLVGAGPGEPALISVRGRQYLNAADVVVYDHLVHRRQLRDVRPGAEIIDLGAPAAQALEQDAIGFLLAEKAREGKTVVRLKWGDPFIFDSGGQEALFLHKHGIPFEVVPGIPPTIAGPCFAGVPLTYPEVGDALVFIRGHDPNTSPDVDWERVAELRGSIVSYAGGAQLETIIDALLSHGRSPDEPAALIVHGTLPNQRTTQGTLRQIHEIVRDAQRRDPAVLVVGPVVGFRDYLRWFDTRPLFGKRVLVTRPRNQAADMTDRLLELGAEPVEAPTIRIEPPEDYEALDAACEDISSYDWLVFTSVNGVDAFMSRLLDGSRDVRSLGSVRLCAIGPATAARLARHGLCADLVPSEHRAEALFDALQQIDELAGKRFLLPRADLAREVLATSLEQAGAHVTEVTAYRTVLAGGERDRGPDVYRMLLEQEIDVVTFTSASTVRNFVKILGSGPAVDLLRTTLVASIGPITAEAADELGIETAIMPSTYTIPALVDAIADHFAGASDHEPATDERP